MTPEGEKALRAELERRKNKDRPRISAAIADARELGDLKENAEYHSAREEQGMNEARIRDLEARLSHARVIDVTTFPDNGKVIFGVTVTLLDAETEAETRYRIVGEDEADIKAGKISVTSPIARALIGKEEGDVVLVTTPSGQREFEIDKVEYI